MTAAKSTRHPAATPEQKPVAAAPKKAIADNSSPPDASSVSKQRLTFPLAITVAAVLPLAFGLGEIRLKASTSTATELTQLAHDDEIVQSPTAGITSLIDAWGPAVDRAAVRSRSRILSIIGKRDLRRLPPEILYRVGLCQEGLGLWDEAIGSLQSVLTSTDDPVLKTAALFGQARLQLRRNELARSASLLRHLVLHSDSPSLLPKAISREVGFLIPLISLQEAVSPAGRPGRSNSLPRGELFNTSWEILLAWADKQFVTETSTLDAGHLDDTLYVQLRQTGVGLHESLSPEDRAVHIYCAAQPVRSVIQRLADECALKLDWSNLSADPSLDRTVNMRVDDEPVSLSLTTICSEMQWCWTINDNHLKICRARDNAGCWQSMFARTLMSQVKHMPQERLASHARFALAEIVQIKG